MPQASVHGHPGAEAGIAGVGTRITNVNTNFLAQSSIDSLATEHTLKIFQVDFSC